MNAKDISPQAEVEVLESVLRHTRQIALTKDPAKRIAASRLEIEFSGRVQEKKAAAAREAAMEQAAA